MKEDSSVISLLGRLCDSLCTCSDEPPRPLSGMRAGLILQLLAHSPWSQSSLELPWLSCLTQGHTPSQNSLSQWLINAGEQRSSPFCPKSGQPWRYLVYRTPHRVSLGSQGDSAEAWSVQSLPQMWTPKALCWGCPACWSLQHLLPCRAGFLLLNSQQAEGSCDRVLTNGRWAEWSGLGSISGVGGSVCEVVQTAHEGDLPEWKINFPCVKLLRFGICFGLCKHNKLSYQTLAYPIFSMALAFLFQNLSNSRGRSSHKLMSGYTINICCFSYVCLS